MNILYVSQYFPPEMGAPAARVSELGRHWAAGGHQVAVLTGFPNHPTGKVPREYRARFRRLLCREERDGMHVVRTWLWPLPNRRSYERILNYSSFLLSSCLTGSFLRRPDIIIATTPQLLVGLTGWWLGLVKRAPFVLEVRDLWPDSIVASGMGGQSSLLTRSLGALARFLYRRCTHVVVVTPALREELIGRWRVPPEKVSVVENGVETDLFTPNGASEGSLDDHSLKGRFVVSYIGTLGSAHGLDTVLQAASRLRDTAPEIVFLLVGEGAEKTRLVALARQQGLSNIHFLGERPREQVPGIIRASQLCLVPLRKADVFTTVVPTKMLEFMACGCPVVLSVDGQARKVLEEARAGLFVEPENPDAIAQAIVDLYRDRDLRQSLGANGRRYAVEHLSRAQTASRYLDLLEKVAQEWRQRRRN